VHEVVVDQEVRSRAPEEFSSRSKLNRRFFSASKLLRLHDELDPWSRVIFEAYLAPENGLEVFRQKRLPVVAD